MRLRFGLDGRGGRTLTAISRDFDLTRERIRPIEVKALARLREAAGPLGAWRPASAGRVR